MFSPLIAHTNPPKDSTCHGTLDTFVSESEVYCASAIKTGLGASSNVLRNGEGGSGDMKKTLNLQAKEEPIKELICHSITSKAL